MALTSEGLDFVQLVNNVPYPLRIPVSLAATSVLLRGLVQHVLSLCRHLGDFPGT